MLLIYGRCIVTHKIRDWNEHYQHFPSTTHENRHTNNVSYNKTW